MLLAAPAGAARAPPKLTPRRTLPLSRIWKGYSSIVVLVGELDRNKHPPTAKDEEVIIIAAYALL